MSTIKYISIGIPFYNAEEYLSDAIKSILAQSYQYWELMLVDDGSTDHSLEIAKQFALKDKRIRVISDGLNKKLPYRLNQIIDESKYDYIARMDADDLIHPDKLKIQLNFLENNKEFDLVSTGVISINNRNEIKGIRCVTKIYTDFSQVKRHYPIVHASILARKNWYKRNKYNIGLPRAEDYELWCRTISNNDLKLAVLPEPLYYYREEGLVTAEKMKNSYIDCLKIYKNFSENISYKEVFKEHLKIHLIDILDSLGLLQNIVRLRNKKEIRQDLIVYNEKILNDILSK